MITTPPVSGNGPESMVNVMQNELVKQGVKFANVHREYYNSADRAGVLCNRQTDLPMQASFVY